MVHRRCCGDADRSDHPNVVEYGVREMMKGKSPAAAAKATAKKLSGGPNMFLASPAEPVSINADVLADALWARLVDFTAKGIERIKPGMEHYALDGTVQHFKQTPKVRAELKSRMGHDRFPNDDAPALSGLGNTRVKLGATQAGAVEIYVTDDCHESRLTLDGQTLVVPAGMSLFDAAGEIIEAANSADDDALRADNAEDRAGFRELRDALSAVATKLGKMDRSSR